MNPKAPSPAQIEDYVLMTCEQEHYVGYDAAFRRSETLPPEDLIAGAFNRVAIEGNPVKAIILYADPGKFCTFSKDDKDPELLQSFQYIFTVDLGYHNDFDVLGDFPYSHDPKRWKIEDVYLSTPSYLWRQKNAFMKWQSRTRKGMIAVLVVVNTASLVLLILSIRILWKERKETARPRTVLMGSNSSRNSNAENRDDSRHRGADDGESRRNSNTENRNNSRNVSTDLEDNRRSIDTEYHSTESRLLNDSEWSRMIFSRLGLGPRLTFDNDLSLTMRTSHRSRFPRRAMLDRLPIVPFREHSEDIPTNREGKKTMVEVSHAQQTTGIVERGWNATTSVTSTLTSPQELCGTTFSQSTSCSICTQDYLLEENVRLLPCFHKSHPGCIDQWLLSRGKMTCPLW